MGFQAIGFDDFAKELDRLGKLDEYAPDMLETAAPILERELKGQVQAEANRGYATGDLAGSIKSRKPEKNIIRKLIQRNVLLMMKTRNGHCTCRSIYIPGKTIWMTEKRFVNYCEKQDLR